MSFGSRRDSASTGESSDEDKEHYGPVSDDGSTGDTASASDTVAPTVFEIKAQTFGGSPAAGSSGWGAASGSSPAGPTLVESMKVRYHSLLHLRIGVCGEFWRVCRMSCLALH
jgi:hypothetical protein